MYHLDAAAMRPTAEISQSSIKLSTRMAWSLKGTSAASMYFTKVLGYSAIGMLRPRKQTSGVFCVEEG